MYSLVGNKSRLREQQPQVYWIDALCVWRPGDSSVQCVFARASAYVLCFCSAEHVPAKQQVITEYVLLFGGVRTSHREICGSQFFVNMDFLFGSRLY